MSIKKSLLALAVMGLALMGFASSAMAEGGKVVDVTTGAVIPEGRELHFVGWAKFAVINSEDSFECHVTAIDKVTGNEGKTGHVKTFTITETSKCKGTGILKGCEPEKHVSTTTEIGGSEKETWDVTTTKEDFDVLPINGATKLTIHIKFKGFCFASGTEVTLTFDKVTLQPLNTTNAHAATNTSGNLGETAKPGEKIAGVEISGEGKIDEPLGERNIKASGELELTEADRCTWKLAAA